MKILKQGATQRFHNVGLLFITPFFLTFLVFQLYPIVYTFYLSFTKYDGFGTPEFLGLKNYANLVKDVAFWTAFLNTWRIWLPNIILQLGIALFFAAILSNIRLKIKAVGFFRAVFYFPNLITAASIALLFNVLLDYQNGAINQILFGDNVEKYVNWLSDPFRAQIIVSLIQTWLWFGYSMIVLMAGIMGIPRTYYEASEIDGATAWIMFWRITMPLLRPIMLFMSVTSLIGGLQLFDLPRVLFFGGGGGPNRAARTIVMYLYDTGFKFERFGYASAISYLLLILLIIFSTIVFKAMNKKEA